MSLFVRIMEDSPCDGRAANKPWRTPGESKKFAVCVSDGDKKKVVRFGDPSMEIKRDDPKRRKNFRARHGCDEPGPKTKPRYWSCQGTWHPTKSVSQAVSESLFDRIVEERPMRSGAVAVSVKTRTCKKPVGCHDRMRSRFRADSPTDKLGPEAQRIATLGGSLKSALMCRDVEDVQKYIKLISQAIAGIAKKANLPKSRSAFDAEQRVKCPKTEDKIPGGKGDKLKPSDVDPEQLKLGMSVEMEHTTDKAVAKEIALDHLAEDPRYYSKLKKIHHEADLTHSVATVAPGSNRSGMGTAPLPDARQELENTGKVKPFPKRKRNR